MSAIFSVSVPGTPVLQVDIESSDESGSGNSLALDMKPGMATADFESGSFTVTVGTSNTKGYTLSLQSSSTAMESPAGSTIPTLSVDDSCPNGYTEDSSAVVANSTCEFTVNRWGWKKSTSDFYLPATTAATELAKSEKETDGESTVVDLATKINAQQDPGTYDVVLTFVAVANTNAQISALEYMQDFNVLTAEDIASVKDSMTLNESYTLKDIRDNKDYFVTKYEIPCKNPRVVAMESGDNKGKCYQIWMSQNLDLDLETSPNKVATLTSNNTDLHSATGIYSSGYTTNGSLITYTPAVATVTAVNQTDNQQELPRSFDPGAAYYYKDATSVSSSCTDANTCAHWHAGNYYNWTAAIASNNSHDQSANYVEAANSVCPAGWRLPTGLTGTTGEYYSDYNYLLVQYGIATNYVGASTNATWTSGGYSAIQGSPLYIPRSGNFYSGSLYGAASDGYLWSSTSVSGSNAYRLGYRSSDVGPAVSGSRYFGFPVRCIVRES